MFLNFIGCGSALNTLLGNNSAYVKKGNSMLLIDCGSTTFSKLQSQKLLDETQNIYVLITHRHPDHIASLGDLIFYVHYILKSSLTIFTPDKENIISLLKYMGVDEHLYTIIKLKGSYTIQDANLHLIVEPVQVPHVEQMDSYGYIIEHQNSKIFYSGDSKDIPNRILDLFCNKEIDYIYQDVCSYDYPDNPHLYIDRLCSLIDIADRDRVFCMHYDENYSGKKVQSLGFRAVECV